MDEEITVECLGLAHGGSMICEVRSGPDATVGKKAFVAGLIPGESASVRVTEEKKSFVMADLVDINSPSPQRIVPPCPVFGRCGGCDLQYIPLELQRELKREMFEKTLQRQAGLVLPGPVKLLGADLPGYGYRKRISLHLSTSGELGFFREGTGEIVSFSRCLISSDAINALLPSLHSLAKDIAAIVAGIMVEEFHGQAVPIFLLRFEPTDKQFGTLRENVTTTFPLGRIYYNDGLLHEWHGGLERDMAREFSTLSHFSQINEAGNQILVAKVLDALDGATEVSEFYAGAGNFSFPLARAGKTVDAIEVDGNLVQRGSEAAQIEGLKRLKFIQSSTERYLEKVTAVLRTSVLLDPPRSGARALCESLSPTHVKSVVYVSCGLPTLTRDLAILVAAGFELQEVSVLDMFSQTHHVESVSILRAR